MDSNRKRLSKFSRSKKSLGNIYTGKERRRSSADKQQLISPSISRDASYTNILLDYEGQCRQRYVKAGVTQRKQFIKEIHRLEMLQEKALDCVRIHRIFHQTIRKPPNPSEIVKLNRKEQYHLGILLDG